MTKTTLLKKLLSIGLALMFILSMPGVSAIAEAAGSTPETIELHVEFTQNERLFGDSISSAWGPGYNIVDSTGGKTYTDGKTYNSYYNISTVTFKYRDENGTSVNMRDVTAPGTYSLNETYVNRKSSAPTALPAKVTIPASVFTVKSREINFTYTVTKEFEEPPFTFEGGTIEVPYNLKGITLNGATLDSKSYTVSASAGTLKPNNSKMTVTFGETTLEEAGTKNADAKVTIENKAGTDIAYGYNVNAQVVFTANETPKVEIPTVDKYTAELTCDIPDTVIDTANNNGVYYTFIYGTMTQEEFESHLTAAVKGPLSEDLGAPIFKYTSINPIEGCNKLDTVATKWTGTYLDAGKYTVWAEWPATKTTPTVRTSGVGIYVAPRPLLFRGAGSGSEGTPAFWKYYDGTPLHLPEIQLITGVHEYTTQGGGKATQMFYEMVEGDSYDTYLVNEKGENADNLITNAGWTTNYFYAHLKSDKLSDKQLKTNYIVTLDMGPVGVFPRTVYIYSQSFIKAYDGKVLNNATGGKYKMEGTMAETGVYNIDEYNAAYKYNGQGSQKLNPTGLAPMFDAFGFVEGEGIESIKMTGDQTEPGNSKNTFEYTLKDNTLAGNYMLAVNPGILYVTESPDDYIATVKQENWYYGDEKDPEYSITDLEGNDVSDQYPAPKIEYGYHGSHYINDYWTDDGQYIEGYWTDDPMWAERRLIDANNWGEYEQYSPTLGGYAVKVTWSDPNYVLPTVVVETQYNVYPRPIRIQTPSLAKIYDGKPAEARDAYLVGGEYKGVNYYDTLAYDDKFDFDPDSFHSQTNVTVIGVNNIGDAGFNNRCDWWITDGNDEIVAASYNMGIVKNYKILEDIGGIAVYRRPVVFISENRDGIYDGKPLSDKEHNGSSVADLIESGVISCEYDYNEFNDVHATGPNKGVGGLLPEDAEKVTIIFTGELNEEGHVNGSNKFSINWNDVTMTNYYFASGYGYLDLKAGKLTVSKAVVGGEDDGSLNQNYSFTVTGPLNSEKCEDRTIDIPANGSYTFDLLIPGIYKVTEDESAAAIEGYRLDVEGQGEIAVTVDGTAVTTVTNTYAKEYGSLKLTKQVTGISDKKVYENKTFKFTVTGGPDGYYKQTIEMTGAGSVTIPELEPGTYTVTELTADVTTLEAKDNDDKVIGKWVLDTGEGQKHSVDVVVVKDDVDEEGNTVEHTVEAVIVNNYVNALGNLTLEKKFKFIMDDGDEEPAKPASVTLVVSGPSGTFTRTLSEDTNWSAIVPNLLPGEYTVTEEPDGTEITGWTLNTSEEVTVTVEENKEAVAKFTNTYTKQYGSLTLVKTVVGADEAPDSVKKFTFRVTFPDGHTKDVELGSVEGLSKTLDRVPVGVYTVEELPDGIDVLKDETVGREWTLESTERQSKSATIGSDGDAETVEITNTYKEKLGELNVKKTITFTTAADGKALDSPEASALNGLSFRFIIEGPSGRFEETLSAANGWAATLKGLKPGTYIVTEEIGTAGEIVTNSDGIIRKWTLDNADVPHTAAATVSVETGADTQTAEIVNNYTEVLGSLKLEKSVLVTDNAVPGGEVADNPAPAVTEVSETEVVAVTGGENAEAFAAAAELPEPAVTTAPEAEPEITTSVETEPEVTSPAETDPAVTTSPEAETEAETTAVTDPMTGEEDRSVPESVLKSRTYTIIVTGPNGYRSEVSISDGQTVILEGLVPGSYTVSESGAEADGWYLTVDGLGSVSVNSNDQASRTVTNNYGKIPPEVGSLTINKTVIGGGTEAAEKTYSFTVTYSDGSSQSVSITGSGSRTIYNLRPGTYTVAEAAADISGYDHDDVPTQTVTVTAGVNAQADFTNRYTEKRGTLTLAKSVVGAEDAGSKDKTYVFNVTYPDGHSETVEFNELSGWSRTLTDLPLGSYAVTEVREGADINGYTLNVAGEGSVVFDDDNLTGSVTITNTYTEKGRLSLEKVFTGLDTLTEDERNALTFVFTVTGDNDYSNTVVLTSENGWKDVLTGLEPGLYTVTEQNADIDGYELTTVTGSGDSYAISDGVSLTATVRNEYTKLGSITITKTVTGGDAGAADRVYDFEITDSYGLVRVIPVRAGESATVRNLRPGRYTVRERSAEIEGYDLNVTGEGEVSINANDVRMNITNAYTELGSLTVSKTVIGGGAAVSGKTFTFDITGPEGYINTVAVAAGGSLVLNDLVPGVYTVTERVGEAQLDDYNLTVTSEGTSTVPEGGNAAVAFTNTYVQKTGSLTVSKELVGGDEAAAGKTYTFDIVGSDGYSSTVTVTGASSVTVEDLPVGIYTVTERDASIDGYRLTVTGSGQQVAITEGSSAAATITNTYEKIVGSLTIAKNVVGGENAGASAVEYVFIVTGPDGYYETVTVAGNSSVTLENLTPGTYTVTEINAGIPNYRLETTGTGEVEVAADSDTAVTVTNRYIELRSITVTKEWYVNGTRSAAPDNAVITVRLYADGVPEGSAITISAATNWFGSFNDLPVYADDGHRISYFVVEDSFNGWNSTTTGSADAGFVIVNSTTAATPVEPEPEIPEPEIPEPEIPESEIVPEPEPEPEIEIPEPEIPLTDIPDPETPLTDITDTEIPLTDIVPETGDNSNLALWVSLMIASGLGIAAILAALLAGKKKAEAEEE